jgi:hypothetical protein
MYVIFYIKSAKADSHGGYHVISGAPGARFHPHYPCRYRDIRRLHGSPVSQADAYSPEIFHFWGRFFLILIPVSIAARIIIQILFVILNTIATREEISDRGDERTRLIELKSTRNGMWIFVLGFFLAMSALVAELQPSIMFVVLIGSGLLASLVSDVSEFYFYRRGF